ncbi:type I glyceraldehyde-3-phosphate dehydrogenase [Taurinivorans muris]|jgi:glyceraldehyde-3-phosphate dehydrogenase, type I|uniref:Glyceraldehyde-3-phosphate dehydrogenase n=1 Tax=Taurinivorans muris TaxID=2787751 RepID=A0ABY5XZ04_9BACT|nr:type I glyceraldehyde-3-phosphate dehydrogenase [Desulfovibrionaceae bacterium LT0009]HBV41166.1 type I glyceraldehyde-3-phosphate dehydrogenase [Desulfovibrio sp.]
MAVKKIGINGFGRIGRYLVRLLADSNDLEVAVINARADNAGLAHLLKYDSTHGHFPYPVEACEEGIIVNGKTIKVTRDPLGEWKWGELGIDLVIETTGKMKDKTAAMDHIKCGAKKVIVSAPTKEADATIVMGVNDSDYDVAAHQVISAASCTTNCLAPATKVIDENFGIVKGLMTTIHSYTMSQRILDGSHKDLRRARSCAVSMIPTSTGAARAIGLVYPKLKGKIDGMAIRVPTPNVSIVDFTVTLEKPATVEEINAALKKASQGAMKDNLGYTEEPLVSIDFNGDTHGGVVDAELTSVIEGNMAKVIIWYDNEASFTNQLVRLTKMVAKSM